MIRQVTNALELPGPRGLKPESEHRKKVHSTHQCACNPAEHWPQDSEQSGKSVSGEVTDYCTKPTMKAKAMR